MKKNWSDKSIFIDLKNVKSMFFTLCILCICAFSNLDAQTVMGTLTDEGGEPLIGVNVLVQDSNRGTITDIDGKYSIQASPGETLVFSYVGFNSSEIVVGNDSNISITMVPDNETLDEVVVIGYGTSKKSHLTGAISKVTNEKLDELPVSRVDEALVGQVSGVNIAATEGEAGSPPTIRIRGTGSMVASSDPLIVVDGLIVDNDFLGSLDMNDVESFEVLKDAASSAIYGSRGGNGVILITTKNGESGKTKFSYSGYYGVKEARRSELYDFSVAETVAAEMAANGELSPRTQYKQAIGIDRDWQDVIFDGGSIMSHSISARGGSDKTNFSTTFSFLHDEGVILTDDFKKYSANLKLKTEINDRLSYGLSLAPSYTDRRRFDGSAHDILRQTPWLPLYHDENTIKYVDRAVYPDVQVGDYAIQRHFDNYDFFGDGSEVDISNTSNTNPAAKVLERDRNDYKVKVFGSTYLQYKILDGLKFRTVFSGDFQNTEQDRWQGVQADRRGASRAQLDLATRNRSHLVFENFFTYDREIGVHEFNAVLGMSTEKYNTKESNITGTGYTSDLLRTISAATAISSFGSTVYENSFLSTFGRLNYAYDYKYLASVSFRRDGSSVFGPDNKYGFFPAVSAGWVVSEEDFFNNGIFDFLKLRASYGFTGNNRIDTGNDLIDNYPYDALLGASTAVVNGTVTSGFNALNIANPGLQWERSREINPGIDFGLFNNIISGSVDYYVRTSDQLLLYNPISSTTGFTEALVNLGEVENKGYEVELRTNNYRGSGFTWTSTIIASRNENTLVDFAESNGQTLNVDTKRAALWINQEGNPISSYYGWVVDREIDPEHLKDQFHPIGGEAQDVYVKDLNGDGIIDDDDRTILGNPYPDLVWSFGNNFGFKGLELGLMFQGSHGAEIRNMGDQYLFNHFNSSQDYNPSVTPDQGFIKQKIFTNSIIQDASYVALRNITLGYTLGSDLIAKSKAFTGGRIYISGQNLFYKTAEGYTGFNPESINNTSATTWGYQRAGSPIQKVISAGVNLEF